MFFFYIICVFYETDSNFLSVFFCHVIFFFVLCVTVIKEMGTAEVQLISGDRGAYMQVNEGEI
jgi:hypothetical protein